MTPAGIPLSQATRERLEILFQGAEALIVTEILEQECGSNLPFLEKLDSAALDRWRFAALKLSDGSLEELRRAVDIARQDWRDLLVAAGFGHDPEAHRRWMPVSRG